MRRSGPGINTVPAGQAEAARAIGLTFTQVLGIIVLPQAIRAVIAPLGSVLIALTKNTTVASAIGVAEAALLMNTLIENEADKFTAVFMVIAAGFIVLTLPVGPGVRGTGQAECGEAMSERASVLYDIPGPKAKRVNLIMSVIFGALLLLLAWYVLSTLASKNQLTADKWSPFLESDNWTTYLLPGLWATLRQRRSAW